MEKHHIQYNGQKHGQKLYLFRCSNKTQFKCFVHGLFAESENYLREVNEMSKDDLLILYNKDTGDVIGPFKPVVWGKLLEKNIFDEYPAQVRIEPVSPLHWIRDARSKFNWIEKLMEEIKDKTLIIPEDYAKKLLAILESSEVVTIEELLESPYEIRFMDFLNEKRIMFLRIDQARWSYPNILKEKGGKRPDFLLFLEGSLHAVEVKGREVPNDEFFGVMVREKEIERLKIFNELTSIPVHIAYMESEDERGFHTIPLDELLKSNKRQGREDVEYYYLERYRFYENNEIHKENCIFCKTPRGVKPK